MKKNPTGAARKLNRRFSIRARCIDCSGFNNADVRNCNLDNCPLHPYRMSTGKQDPPARNKAIRDYCLECMNGQIMEVSRCPSESCSLFQYRKIKSTPKKTAYTRYLSEEKAGAIG